MRRLEQDGVLDREIEGLPSRREVRRRLERGPGADRSRAVGADGVDQDRAGRRAARRRPARRPVPRPGPEGLLPDRDARAVREPDRGAPAAPGDHRDPGRQRPGQRRGHDVLAAAGRRDQRQRARPDPGELRGPGDLRLARAARGAEGLRQQARGGGADLDADRDAHPGRAGVALAGHQPPAAAGQPGHRRPVRRAGAEGDGRAARADGRSRARGLPGAAGRPASSAACRRTWRPGSRCWRRRTCCSASSRSPSSGELEVADVARVHFALGERLGVPLLLQRIVALPRADKWQTMARAALRDDLHARARPAHRPGAAHHVGRATPRPPGSREWEDTDAVLVVPGRRHPRPDLRRGGDRPGPDVGRAAGGPRACWTDRARYSPAHDRPAHRRGGRDRRAGQQPGS